MLIWVNHIYPKGLNNPRIKNGIKKGQWMIDWMRRLKEKESKEPYVSDFVKWSKSIKGMYILFFILLLSCSSLVSKH